MNPASVHQTKESLDTEKTNSPGSPWGQVTVRICPGLTLAQCDLDTSVLAPNCHEALGLIWKSPRNPAKLRYCTIEHSDGRDPGRSGDHLGLR